MSATPSNAGNPQKPKSSSINSPPSASPAAPIARDTAKLTQDLSELELKAETLYEPERTVVVTIKVEPEKITKSTSASTEGQHNAPEQPPTHDKNMLDVQEVKSTDGSRYFMKIVFYAPKTVDDLLKLLRIEYHVTGVFAQCQKKESFEIAWNSTTNQVVTDSSDAEKEGDQITHCTSISGTTGIADGRMLLVEYEDPTQYADYGKLSQFLERSVQEGDLLTRIPGIGVASARKMNDKGINEVLDLLKIYINCNKEYQAFLERLRATFEDIRQDYIETCVNALCLSILKHGYPKQM